MTKNPQTTIRHSATIAQMDILELLRSGTLSNYPGTLEPGTIRMELGDLHAPGQVHAVELTDQEGVPLARLPLQRGPEGSWLALGEPTWLSRRSSRPFERWHRPPQEVSDHSGVVVLRHAVSSGDLDAAVTEVGPHPLILALASLDGDPPPETLAAVRQLADAAQRHPDAQVAIAPGGSTLTPPELDLVIRAYAGEKPHVVLDSHAHSTHSRTGVVLFLTGLSGSGKSTIARAVRNRLVEAGDRVTLLDGDVVRRHLSAGLGFSPSDRDTNIRRIGWVAAEIAYHGGLAICSPIAPFEQTRQDVRSMVEARGARFVLVHVATPLAECERRDRKGLYAKARRGEIADFTGVSSPYEEPVSADLRVDTTGRELEPIVAQIMPLLREGGAC